jgi:hypothetical protein
MIEAEEKMVKLSLDHSRPLGSEAWARKTTGTLRLEHTLRPRGRREGWRKRPEKMRKSI